MSTFKIVELHPDDNFIDYTDSLGKSVKDLTFAWLDQWPQVHDEFLSGQAQCQETGGHFYFYGIKIEYV